VGVEECGESFGNESRTVLKESVALRLYTDDRTFVVAKN